ncbi:UTRA domain-containing protein [Sneathiella chinensis]|uniref:UTRA domain-containing protein n=1 Tax=Sneathiella chinensis TaxID=349750 RepID=UPI0019D12755
MRKLLLKRIHSGEWAPGAIIPVEADLAVEYGCSRTTVNRALRQLAEAGIVERRRKRGTRVNPTPVARTTLEIPIIRQEVTDRGGDYSHHILLQEMAPAPAFVYAKLGLPDQDLLHLETLHLSDNRPYMVEDRWVNVDAAPHIKTAPFDKISPNEWLVQEVPYSDGEISFSACAADERVAELLEVKVGTPLFLVERTTWMDGSPITTLKMYYTEGFRMSSRL